MKFRYLLILFSLLFVISSLHGYSIGFDYAHVRSTSFPTFMPYQYANYFDVIDLRYSLYGGTLVSPVNVIVSPKVYGINKFGQRIFIYNIPTQSFLITPQSNFSYTYNPMFYFDPDYQSYEIDIALQSNDGTYQTSKTAYIYKDQSSIPQPPFQPPQGPGPTCDDFYLSGFKTIYLDEDKRDFYNLYITNTINQSLTITSITTNPLNPRNLNIENISHPYTIFPYDMKSAIISLHTDTVSSNYIGSFDIDVIGNYGTLSCQKTYTVQYRINKKDLPNNSDCNDILLEDFFFTINSNETKTFDIEIKNRSENYYFDVDNIKINYLNQNLLDVSILNNINIISEDSSENLKIRVEAEKTDRLISEKIELEIDGYYKRDNREDKRCRIRRTVTFRINPSSLEDTSNECKEITIFTRNLSLLENTTNNFSEINGFYIYNNSNKSFTITGINYYENSPYFDLISKAPSTYTIFSKSTNSLNFSINTNEVLKDITSIGRINIQGTFSDGSFCNYSDISSTFNVSVIKDDNVCSNVGFNDYFFKEGQNYITIFNNTDVDFTVKDIIALNKKNTNVNIINKGFILPKNSEKLVEVYTSGSGSFELLSKGLFSDGTSCDYVNTSSGFFKKDSLLLADVCDFTFNYPNAFFVTGEKDSFTIYFNNLSNKSGRLRISSTGAVVYKPLINITPYASFTETITLSNLKNPKNIIYTIDFSGCDPVSKFTDLHPVLSFDKEVYFLSSVSNIKTLDNKFVSNFSLKNNSNQELNLEIRFSGFTDDIKFVKSDVFLDVDTFVLSQDQTYFNIGANSSKNIYFGAIVSKNAKNIKYNGNIEIYNQGRLILKEPLTIDREILKDAILISLSTEKTEKRNTILLSFIFENTTENDKNLKIFFNDLNSFESIEGNLEFLVPSLEKQFESYKINYGTLSSIEYQIIDLDTNSVLKEGNFGLAEFKDRPGFLTGFLSFGSLSDILAIILIILIIAAIVYLVYRFAIHRKRIRKAFLKKDNLLIKEDVLKENISKNDEDMLDKKMSDDLLDDKKQITLKELEKFEKNTKN